MAQNVTQYCHVYKSQTTSGQPVVRIFNFVFEWILMIADRVRKLFVYEKIEAAGKNEKSIITHHKIIKKFINCSVEKTVDSAQKATTIKQTPFKLDIT